MKGALINSETILLRLQLFQYVNVPHQTKLTKCIVTIQKKNFFFGIVTIHFVNLV